MDLSDLDLKGLSKEELEKLKKAVAEESTRRSNIVSKSSCNIYERLTDLFPSDNFINIVDKYYDNYKSDYKNRIRAAESAFYKLCDLTFNNYGIYGRPGSLTSRNKVGEQKMQRAVSIILVDPDKYKTMVDDIFKVIEKWRRVAIDEGLYSKDLD